MRKIGMKVVMALGASAALMVATPAAAGTAIFFYSDYPGGTPAGYRIICDSGYTYSWGVETGIFYVGPYIYC